jgi:transketolase
MRDVPDLLRLLPPGHPPFALMSQRVVYVMTHDSIGLGEDGPTHQPSSIWRPCAPFPTCMCSAPPMRLRPPNAGSWRSTRQSEPLALTRQNLAPVRLDHVDENLCARGAYEVAAAEGEAQVSLFASGSEVGDRHGVKGTC